jgi:hypothetical protein
MATLNRGIREYPQRPDHRAGRRRRALVVALLAVAAVLVAGRLALTPFVARQTRHVLQNLKGYRGSFDDVSFSLRHLSYTIEGLKLVQIPTPPGGDEKRPLFYARRVEIGLHWGDLIHRHELVGTVELDGPKLNLIAGKSRATSQLKIADPELADKLKALSPLDVERIELKGAEVSFADETGKGAPALWLHDVDATLENLATRVGLSHGEPTTLAASGTLQKTGQVSVFVTADPLAKTLGFSGRASVQHLALTDVGNFLVHKTDLAPRKGSIDLFAEFDVRGGRISGGVKPLLKHVDLKAAKGGVGPKLKSWIGNSALHIFSDRVPGRNAAAAVVPIHGTISNPEPQLWPTVWGVLRNAFVAGLESGFLRVPAGNGTSPQARSVPQKSHR